MHPQTQTQKRSTRRFNKDYDDIRKRKDLTRCQKDVYAALGRIRDIGQRDSFQASYVDLADRAACSKQAAITAIKRLMEVGLITKLIAGRGQGNRCWYQLTEAGPDDVEKVKNVDLLAVDKDHFKVKEIDPLKVKKLDPLDDPVLISIKESTKESTIQSHTKRSKRKKTASSIAYDLVAQWDAIFDSQPVVKTANTADADAIQLLLDGGQRPEQIVKVFARIKETGQVKYIPRPCKLTQPTKSTPTTSAYDRIKTEMQHGAKPKLSDEDYRKDEFEKLRRRAAAARA